MQSSVGNRPIFGLYCSVVHGPGWSGHVETQIFYLPLCAAVQKSMEMTWTGCVHPMLVFSLS
jgi:hypothetical protein